MSFNSYNLDTKFGKAKDFVDKIEEITKKKIIHTIEGAEPIGPQRLTDVMVIAPCSRKHSRKNGKWDNGHKRINGCKITSKK